jgi:cell division protein FtsB
MHSVSVKSRATNIIKMIEMTETEKKGIGKAKVGLIISAILVIILAVTNVWSYTNLQNQIITLNNEQANLQSQVNTLQTDKANLQSQIDSLNVTYQDYISTHSHSNPEYDDLNSTYQHYISTHSYTDSEHDTLENERDTLRAPKLKIESLFVDDVRPWWGAEYLHVYGEVWNVGTDTAYDCRLHVMAYQESVLAIDTYIWLGTINGENNKNVDSKIYYLGSALTKWYIFSEWG